MVVQHYEWLCNGVRPIARSHDNIEYKSDVLHLFTTLLFMKLKVPAKKNTNNIKNKAKCGKKAARQPLNVKVDNANIPSVQENDEWIKRSCNTRSGTYDR